MRKLHAVVLTEPGYDFVKKHRSFVVSVLMVDSFRQFVISYRIHNLQGNGKCNKDQSKLISFSEIDFVAVQNSYLYVKH